MCTQAFVNIILKWVNNGSSRRAGLFNARALTQEQEPSLLLCVGRSKKAAPNHKNGILEAKQKPRGWGEALLWVVRPRPARGYVFWVMQLEYNQCASSVCPQPLCLIYCRTWHAFTRCTWLHNQTFANSKILIDCVKMCIDVAKTRADQSGQLFSKNKYPKFELFGSIVAICLGYLCDQSLV